MPHIPFDTLEHVLHMISYCLRASYLKICCCCSGFNNRIWMKHFANSIVDKNDLVCPFELWLNQCCPARYKTIFKPFLYTDFDYGLFRLSDLHHWLKVDVTGQQGILTPSRHLIPHLVYPGVRVSHALILDFFFGIREWLRFVIFVFSSKACNNWLFSPVIYNTEATGRLSLVSMRSL